jgi:hypothetical protein
MTDYENTIVEAARLQAKIRNCEEEGTSYPMEKEIEVLFNYKAISGDCFVECIRILL